MYVLKPGHIGSPGHPRFAFKIERMVLVKKLLALALVVCVVAISSIGCGGDTSKPAGGTGKPAGGTGTAK